MNDFDAYMGMRKHQTCHHRAMRDVLNPGRFFCWKCGTEVFPCALVVEKGKPPRFGVMEGEISDDILRAGNMGEPPPGRG
jgi:hypothetical protein